MASENENGVPPIEIPTESLEFEHVKRDKTVKPSLGRRLVMIMILAAAVAGAGAWWIFDGQYSTMFAGNSDGQVPTVHAEISPVKIKPENPGGMDVPNQDKLVYERLGQEPTEQRVESLLPEPEKPMPKPEPQAEEKNEPMQEKAVTAPEPPKPPAVPTKEVVEQKLAAAQEPKVVSPTPTAKEVAAVEEPKPAEIAKPMELKEPAAAPKEVESVSAPAPSQPPKVEAKPKAEPKPAPKTTSVDISKSYQVQLAAVRSTATAQSEWQRMQKKFPAQLEGLQLNVVKADLGKKGIFYRLRAGPVADANAAKAICDALKAKKAGCLVVRPGK